MKFTDISFLLFFLPCLILLYYLLPKKLRKVRNGLLLCFSVFFYAFSGVRFLALLMVSILINYIGGMLAGGPYSAKFRKTALIVSVALNLLLLGWFKYAGFFFGIVSDAVGGITIPQVILPIGISFYTFQGISYVVDVYKNQVKRQQNPFLVALYISFFPQLVAGPIVLYPTIEKELSDRNESLSQFSEGVIRFSIGLAKKVLLADVMAKMADQVFSTDIGSLTTPIAWLGAVAYAFQIYFDFSGYSDMAIGLGKMFGFTFLENFEHPYISRSITEFWRRWHISLGTWFREYVYIPLGGNRKGAGRQLVNIAIVWLLTGIWHGASWNFLAWGAYYCVLLIVEKLFLLRLLEKLPRAVSHVYTLFCVMIGWVLFAFDSFATGLTYLGQMFGAGGVPLVNNVSLFALVSHLVLLVLLALGATPLPARVARRVMDKLPAIPASAVFNAVMLFVFWLSIAYLVDSSYNPFLYFRF